LFFALYFFEYAVCLAASLCWVAGFTAKTVLFGFFQNKIGFELIFTLH